MTRCSSHAAITRLLALPLALALAACGGDTPPASEEAADSATELQVEAIEPTEADSEPDRDDRDRGSADAPLDADTAADADASETDNSTAKGGDPALLIGQWEPIAYVRPDGVKADLVELPEPERAELAWEFGEDGSVKSGLSVGTFEVEGVTFVATNAESGEARTFRYTVTEDRLFVINPAGDRLELQRIK